eukprot:COSAG01_NODE_46846_length_396_cov_0.818182_2_plen_55_part_01
MAAIADAHWLVGRWLAGWLLWLWPAQLHELVRSRQPATCPVPRGLAHKEAYIHIS